MATPACDHGDMTGAARDDPPGGFLFSCVDTETLRSQISAEAVVLTCFHDEHSSVEAEEEAAAAAAESAARRLGSPPRCPPRPPAPLAQTLLRDDHVKFLGSNISQLDGAWQSLDASHPWLVYWMTHALDLLGGTERVYRTVVAGDRIVDYLLSECFETDDDVSCPLSEVVEESRTYGPGRRAAFAGGPRQLPHLASTFAAVNAIVINGSPESWARVDREAIGRWLVSLRQPDGSFRMQRSGEVDVRATYCAASVATLLGLDMDDIFPSRCAEYVASCQTHEGGIGSCATGSEAHGGYSMCGYGALLLLGRYDLIDGAMARRWCALRQQQLEGGFCGRTNKLVDSCYSYWMGASYALTTIGEAQMALQAALETSAADDHGDHSSAGAPPAAGSSHHAHHRPHMSGSVPSFHGQHSAASVRRAAGQLSELHRHVLQSAQIIPDDDYEGEGEVDASDDAAKRRDAHHRTVAHEHQQHQHGGDGTVPSGSASSSSASSWLFDEGMLQRYVLQCCQNITGSGTKRKASGLMDKPGCYPDFYHTCYSLSGMSVAQHATWATEKCPPPTAPGVAFADCWLRPTNPVLNLCRDRVKAALAYFGRRQVLATATSHIRGIRRS